jgi:hypothetical protein
LYQSWAEGADNDGTGATFTIEFDKPTTVSSFMLKNGYGQLDYYFKNNRIKEVIVEADAHKFYGTLTGFKNISMIQIADTPEFVQYDLRQPVTCTQLKFMITEVYKGTQFNDTCVAEIFVLSQHYDGTLSDFYKAHEYSADSYTTQMLKGMNDIKQGIFDVNIPTLFNSITNDRPSHGYTRVDETARYGIYMFNNTTPLLLTQHYEESHVGNIPTDIEAPIIRKFENGKWVEKPSDPFIAMLLQAKDKIEKSGMAFEIELHPDKIEALARPKYSAVWPMRLGISASHGGKPVQKTTYQWTENGFALYLETREEIAKLKSDFYGKWIYNGVMYTITDKQLVGTSLTNEDETFTVAIKKWDLLQFDWEPTGDYNYGFRITGRYTKLKGGYWTMRLGQSETWTLYLNNDKNSFIDFADEYNKNVFMRLQE